MSKSPSIVAAAIVLSLSLSSYALGAETAPSADQILNEVKKKVSANDESATIEMTNVEANSGSKTRDIEIRRKTSGASQKVMVKIKTPASLHGTALLSVSDDKKEDQWLFLPSSKQVRRILSSNKSANFLDSELSYEDMGGTAVRKCTNTLLRTETSPEGNVAVIESRMAPGDSGYSRILTWVPLSNYLVTKAEYYDHGNKLLKVTEMGTYKKFPGDIWRTQDVNVKNVQNHRSTHLVLKDLKVNQGIGDSDFTEAAMQDE
jgi:hypothetical protein